MKINKLGKELVIKEFLTVGDMFKLSKLEKEEEYIQMLNIVSLAIIKPKMTVKNLEDLEGKYLEDLSEIVSIVTGSEEE